MGKIRAIYTSMVKNVLRNCYHLRRDANKIVYFAKNQDISMYG